MRRRLLVGALVLATAAAAFVALGGYDGLRRMAYPLEYRDAIAREASHWDVDPYLVAAVARTESGFDPNAVSGAGAVGLMQVKPSTARSIASQNGIAGKFNATTLKDPELNIRVGTAYLSYLLARYEGNEAMALAAYNGGLTNADAWAALAKDTGKTFRDVIEFPETAAFVEKVRVQRELYRYLYPDAFVRVGP